MIYLQMMKNIFQELQLHKHHILHPRKLDHKYIPNQRLYNRNRFQNKELVFPNKMHRHNKVRIASFLEELETGNNLDGTGTLHLHFAGLNDKHWEIWWQIPPQWDHHQQEECSHLLDTSKDNLHSLLSLNRLIQLSKVGPVLKVQVQVNWDMVVDLVLKGSFITEHYWVWNMGSEGSNTFQCYHFISLIV